MIPKSNASLSLSLAGKDISSFCVSANEVQIMPTEWPVEKQGKSRKTKRFSRSPEKYAIHTQVRGDFRGHFEEDYMAKHNFIEVGPPLNPLMPRAWHCQHVGRHSKWSRVVGSFSGKPRFSPAFVAARWHILLRICPCTTVNVLGLASVTLTSASSREAPTPPFHCQGQTNGCPMSRDAQGYRVL